MDMEEDDDEELCLCGGVAFRPVMAGGSAFSGLCESSEMPPLPFPLMAGVVGVVFGGLRASNWVFSEDLGDGVAVEMAELPCTWGTEGRAAGWMLLTFFWDSADVVSSDGLSLSSGPFPPASRADSLGLSALRVGASSPSAALSPSPEWT